MVQELRLGSQQKPLGPGWYRQKTLDTYNEWTSKNGALENVSPEKYWLQLFCVSMLYIFPGLVYESSPNDSFVWVFGLISIQRAVIILKLWERFVKLFCCLDSPESQQLFKETWWKILLDDDKPYLFKKWWTSVPPTKNNEKNDGQLRLPKMTSCRFCFHPHQTPNEVVIERMLPCGFIGPRWREMHISTAGLTFLKHVASIRWGRSWALKVWKHENNTKSCGK